MVRRIHHRLVYILLAVTGVYLGLGLVMIGVRRGLSYQPNPHATTQADDNLKATKSEYVDYIDWALDTSKNSVPLSSNHTAHYNMLDMKIVGVIFAVSALSIVIHHKTEKVSE